MLDALAADDPPSQGMLYFGPRGNGKTVLLARIADEARGRGMRAERLPASAFRSHSALCDELQAAAGLAGTRIKGAQAAGFGVSLETGSPTKNLWRLLTAWIAAEQSPLVILLDEVHTVQAVVARDFFDAVQEATTQGLPFWLLAAGTPDAPRRIRQAGTFTERMFEPVPVGRLAREATFRALRTPASHSGLPLEDDATNLLAAESQDYPYFVQLLGSAAWTAAAEADDAKITERSARQGIAATQVRIQQFYAERFEEACGRKIEGALVPLAKRLRQHQGRLGFFEFRPLLAEIVAEQSLSGDETWLRETLSDLGVIWRTPAGWEMGIPSFADYVLGLYAAETSGPTTTAERGS